MFKDSFGENSNRKLSRKKPMKNRRTKIQNLFDKRLSTWDFKTRMPGTSESSFLGKRRIPKLAPFFKKVIRTDKRVQLCRIARIMICIDQNPTPTDFIRT